MTEYDNTNRGALFQSEKKTEKHPDLKGPLNIEGTDYYVSAWSEVSKKDGKKYLSLSVDKKQDKESAPAPAAPAAPAATGDEALPF